MQTEKVDRTYAPDEKPVVLKASSALRRVVEIVGNTGAWLILPLTLVTVADVVARKLTYHAADGTVYSLQLWLKTNITGYFESTLLQELEWHLHTALFALALGLGTIFNTHVRVDLVRQKLDFRRKAWIEFLGVTFFMLPYLLLVIYFASSWVAESYAVNEISASTVGLTHRWIIKGVLVAGLITAALAGLAVWLQLAFLLWVHRPKRFALMTLDWPDEEGARIEGKERISLDHLPAEPEAPSVLARRRGTEIQPAE